MTQIDIATMSNKLKDFDSEKETWPRFIERLKLYFTVIGVGNAEADQPKRKAILLNSMGIDLFNKYRDTHLDAIDTVTFDNIAQRVEAIINPRPIEIAERYKFHSRRQQHGEDSANYMLALRKLALTCNFGADGANALNNRLRDQFVCGLGNKDMQKFLLTQAELTLNNVVTFATSFESAERTTELFSQGAVKDTSVHAVGRKESERKQSDNQARSSKPMFTGRCHHCGKTNHHPPAGCKHRSATCFKCGKTGHIVPVCRATSKDDKSSKSMNRGVNRRHHQAFEIEGAQYTSDEDEDELNQVHVDALCHQIIPGIAPKFLIQLQINNVAIVLEVDTGTPVTIINRNDYEKLKPLTVSISKLKLSSYSGHVLSQIGRSKVRVSYRNKNYDDMTIHIVDGQRTSLMGRQWIDKMNIQLADCYRPGDNATVAMMEPGAPPSAGPRQQSINSLLTEFNDLFDGTLGCITGVEASITLSDTPFRKFWPARPIPFAIEEKVKLELDRLVDRGIIERVPRDISEYASPIVVVAKRGSEAIRLCADFKVSINNAVVMEQYPLPKIDDLFARIGDCKIFSKLDLTEAYHQLKLDTQAQKYTVINTKWGLYRYLRLVFGVSSAPSIFQRTLESILYDLPGVVCELDDVLVAAPTLEEHTRRLRAVFERFRQRGIKLGLHKCVFGSTSVKYLGHVIDATGLHASDDKIQAVMEARVPNNVRELQSFIGLVNYYSKFINNMSTLCNPLYRLLHKDTPWQWGREESNAFQELKRRLSEPPVLCHYDRNLKVGLAVDASEYGVGAVLIHLFDDGTEKPIAYASQTLSASQRNYAQIEKEAYSMIFGVLKFKQYLYGRKFTIITDHKPLLTLLGPNKAIPDRTSNRLKRWALTLSSFNYDLKFRNSTQNANADCLSRLPLNVTAEDNVDIFQLTDDVIENELTSKVLKVETQKDAALSVVLRSLTSGWPSPCPPELQPFQQRRSELATDNGCIYWGQRIIVPTSMRESVLNELHEGHPGMTRMKNLARTLVWWPNLDAAIEKKVQSCSHCQSVRAEAPAAAVHPWEFPTQAWHRLHIDYAGPFHGYMWLVVMDARSKWPEVIAMKSATTATTIKALMPLIARFGVPAQLVSDNGSQFKSVEFAQFCARLHITHITVSPFHPRSNGEAERFVRTVKEVLGKKSISREALFYRLQRFLLSYRNTAHSTTGYSPAQLLLGKRVRLPLDALRPRPEDAVQKTQENQAVMRHQTRHFHAGDTVWSRDYRNNNKWAAGVILEKVAPLTYWVQVGLLKWRRHVDQLLRRDPDCQPSVDLPPFYMRPEVTSPTSATTDSAVQPPPTDQNIPLGGGLPQGQLRRSTRVHQRPYRLIEQI